jgi:hypothetical protein
MVLVAAAALAGCNPPQAADPNAVFALGFDMPLETVAIDNSGGFAVHGHDAWIRVRSDNRVQLKNGETFAPTDPAPALAFFAEQLPQDIPSPVDPGEYLCLATSDESLSHDNGAWLLFKPGTGIYYYRTWEHS